MKKVIGILICCYFMSLFLNTYAYFEDVYRIRINHRLLDETSRISLYSDNVHVKKKDWSIELVRNGASIEVPTKMLEDDFTINVVKDKSISRTLYLINARYTYEDKNLPTRSFIYFYNSDSSSWQNVLDSNNYYSPYESTIFNIANGDKYMRDRGVDFVLTLEPKFLNKDGYMYELTWNEMKKSIQFQPAEYFINEF